MWEEEEGEEQLSVVEEEDVVERKQLDFLDSNRRVGHLQYR